MLVRHPWYAPPDRADRTSARRAPVERTVRSAEASHFQQPHPPMPAPAPIISQVYAPPTESAAIAPSHAVAAPIGARTAAPPSYDAEVQTRPADKERTTEGVTMFHDQHHGVRLDGAALWQQLKTLGSLLGPAPFGEEWEAIIGGSWLNKLGVLVLVIGLALFVGYSISAFLWVPQGASGSDCRLHSRCWLAESFLSVVRTTSPMDED
jgi:uncharacterized membrane protein